MMPMIVLSSKLITDTSGQKIMPIPDRPRKPARSRRLSNGVLKNARSRIALNKTMLLNRTATNPDVMCAVA